MTRIAIDAMGGDNAPRATIEGAVWAAHDYKVPIELVGKEDVIKEELSNYHYSDIVDVLEELKNIIASGEFGEEGYEVLAMIAATKIQWPGLIAFIVFNMTTIPCFAAVAAARGEIAKGKMKWTILFWILTSFIASSFTYVVCTAFATGALWAILVSLAYVIGMVSAIILIRLKNSKDSVKG